MQISSIYLKCAKRANDQLFGLKAENGKLIRDLTELIPNPQCRLPNRPPAIGGAGCHLWDVQPPVAWASARAERRLGEMLTEAFKNGELAHGGQNKKRADKKLARSNTLTKLGITSELSSQAPKFKAIALSQYRRPRPQSRTPGRSRRVTVTGGRA